MLVWLQSSGTFSKERLVSFGAKIEGTVRFCRLVSQIMVYFLKNNSMTQEEVKKLSLNRKLGVSMGRKLLVL